MARYDRKSQLAQMESVIENKKREIQEKLEAQKRKETEEALKKIQTQPAIPPKRPLLKRNDGRRFSKAPAEPIGNVFTNDGSFLDKFRKLSKTGLKPDKVDVETLAKAREAEEQERERKRRLEEERAQKELERRAWEREREFRQIERDQERQMKKSRSREHQWHAKLSTDERSPRTSLGAGIKLNLPPPGMVQIIPQVQIVTPIVVQQQPPQQLILNAPPQFTTNEIQMQANSVFTGPLPLHEIELPDTSQPPPAPPQPLPSFPQQIPIPSILPPVAPASQPPSVSSIPVPPPLHLTPQIIPPPSPIRVSSIPSPTFIHVPSIPSPPSSPTPNAEFIFQPTKLSGIPFFESDPVLDSTNSIPLPGKVSSVDLPSAKENYESPLDSGARHLAMMVANSGDDAEQILRSRNEDDPSLRFLFEPESLKYKLFRRLVEDIRSGKVEELESEPEEVTADISDSDSDDPDNVKKSSDGEKYDPMALSDDSDDEPIVLEREISTNEVKQEVKHTDHNRDHDLTDDNYDEVPRKIKRGAESFASRPSFAGASNSLERKPLEFVSAGSSTLTTRENMAKYEQLDNKIKKRSRWGEKAEDETGGMGIPLPPALPSVGLAAPVQLGLQQAPPPTPSSTLGIQLPPAVAPLVGGAQGPVMLSQITRRSPGLVAYARQTFGSTELSDEDWKRAEDHYKINLLYQDMMNKKAELERMAKKGKFKYEYDSDEEVEGGTWEHKLRQTEMAATEAWATELTRQAEGKHHIGDFLPPDELKRFLEKYNAVKEGREPDLSDYKEFKLKEDNVGYQLLQKMGWSEGQGLGQDGQGIVDPVNKASNRMENQGLGIDRSDSLYAGDDEYAAYRKRMMLAYRFRPNPLNNPRRPYY